MRIFRICFILAMCLGAVAMQVVPSLGQEMRGAWVTAWTPGFFTPEQVDVTVGAAKSVNLNALFIQVRKNADAYYESTLEPRGADIAPGFDPLAYVIEKAHAQGIQVHAWMNTFRVWTAKEAPTDPAHIVNAHRDWLNKDYDGQIRASEGLYLDPGVPEAREHIAAVAVDIARRYDIDGIHLDYIRYPSNKWGYSDIALARYRAQTGATGKPKPDNPQWMQWRRDQVTTLVRMISERVRAVKPNVKITVATIPWGDCPSDFRNSSPYAVVCQDWRTWVNEGLVDANVPMNYKKESNSKNAQQFRNWLDGFKRWSGGRQVWVGIDVTINDANGIRKQMEAVRKSGLEGYVWFSFNASQRRTQLVKALGGYVPEIAQPSESLTVARSGCAQAQAQFDLGIRHAAANQLGMAKVYLRKAIELDPQFAEAYFRLGRCYLRERNMRQATELFNKTLEIDADHEGAKKELEAMK